MKKALIKLLNKLYPKSFISLQTFNDHVRDIAEKYNKDHYQVTVSRNPLDKTKFKGYVSGYWTAEYKTMNEVLDDLILHCARPVAICNVEVLIENI